jgi:hypothetical protein
VLILKKGYKAQKPVMLVNKAIMPITYMTICTAPWSQKNPPTSDKTATASLIKRSVVHSFLFMRKEEKRVKNYLGLWK